MAVIDTVFWDFGGVFTGSPFIGLGNYARSIGAEPEQFRTMLFGDSSADGDHPWHRVERGEMALADAMTAALAQMAEAGFAVELQDVFGSMANGEVGARENVVEMVRRVQASGRRNGIITNNVKEFSNGWRGLLPVDELFAGVTDSSAIGVRKPHPDIYHHALDQLETTPERSVFLDDLAANVEAARSLGMRGIVVGDDPQPALAELGALLGL